jgi:hypothetical protein
MLHIEYYSITKCLDKTNHPSDEQACTCLQQNQFLYDVLVTLTGWTVVEGSMGGRLSDDRSNGSGWTGPTMEFRPHGLKEKE